MNEAEIFEKVKSMVIEKLGKDEREVTREVSFKDLGADSLDVMELITAFENEFWFEVESKDEDKLKTIDGAVKYILRRKSA